VFYAIFKYINNLLIGWTHKVSFSLLLLGYSTIALVSIECFFIIRKSKWT